MGAQLNCPVALAMDNERNLYVAESRGHRVRKVAQPWGSEANISTVAGNGRTEPVGDGMPLSDATLSHPEGLTFSGDFLMISDSGHSRVRRLVPE
ncbi:hypothetical protein [Streptomyces sp. 900105245]